ncbi:MAG: hypothetical protein HZA93_26455 [Verrucomicrobia bacterium]|nr:hypothetical protein [Verrucomicrobiota bacterium]
MKTFEDSQNRTVTGLSAGDNPVVRAARTHQDYWKTRIKHRTFTTRGGRKFTPPELYVRIFHEKREVWFCLDTANRAAAAVKARDIYLSLVAAGWDATLAKFKPKAEEPNEVCTVGEFLADVLKRSHLSTLATAISAPPLRTTWKRRSGSRFASRLMRRRLRTAPRPKPQQLRLPNPLPLWPARALSLGSFDLTWV